MITGNGSIVFMNPLNSLIRSATIGVQFKIKLEFLFSKKFELAFNTSSFEIDLIDFKPLFQTDETLDTISNKFKIVKPFLMEGMNKALKRKLELPIPQNFKDKFALASFKTFY